ncbi:unnamed protein product [Pedinophyceae sp. YPF-701]|nr:unnamed protein product [Pedinophyceae sp. YPF-701]
MGRSRQPGGRRECSLEATAYCSCGYCCNWEWGISLGPLPAYIALQPRFPPVWVRKIDAGCPLTRRRATVFDKFWTATEARGCRYEGLTASGTQPRQARRGLLHPSVWSKPKKLAARLMQPWTWLGRQGTAAADTAYYPFGTQIFVPEHGWVKVEDTGGAIKTPRRLDLYYRSHKEALRWGRREVRVSVIEPGEAAIDRALMPAPFKSLLWGMDAVKHALF